MSHFFRSFILAYSDEPDMWFPVVVCEPLLIAWVKGEVTGCWIQYDANRRHRFLILGACVGWLFIELMFFLPPEDSDE